MISYCGLRCESCEAFVATQNNDDAMRAKIAQKWAETYNAPIEPQHINCTGCRSEGVKFYYTENLCKIRKCASAKNIDTCAACEQYACEDLQEVFQYGPQAKEMLDSLRK